uniref:Uncharacterized protein n=1 Tax=Meloidogyne enterolobii TaxID=390850 RepID=A0A6V7XLA8_MELEN|nr:unnamed protein product [Meloidogyne enterolobii]
MIKSCFLLGRVFNVNSSSGIKLDRMYVYFVVFDGILKIQVCICFLYAF